MIKITRLYTSIFCLMMASQVDAEVMSISLDPTKCKEVVDAAQSAAEAARIAGLNAAQTVKGGPPLDEATCFDSINDLNFDFFSGIPSIFGTALDQAKDKLLDEITNFTCDAANEAIGAFNKGLTCSAVDGIEIDVSQSFDDIGSVGSIDVNECLGAGDNPLNSNRGGSSSVGTIRRTTPPRDTQPTNKNTQGGSVWDRLQ